MLARSISLAVNAVIAIGTSCSDSLRWRAVTVICSRVDLSLVSFAAAAEAAAFVPASDAVCWAKAPPAARARATDMLNRAGVKRGLALMKDS